ncbi:MAG: RNA-binding cell elongation regulator Jag/EloR [Bilophila sp.]
MEDFKEFQGKSLDEAIKGACSYFNASREKLEIDIVQDAKNGIFGLVGARKAIVHARRAQLKSKVGAILGREASAPVAPKTKNNDPRAGGTATPAGRPAEAPDAAPAAKPARSPRPERERRPQRPPRDFGQPSILPREDHSQEDIPFEDETIGNRILPPPVVEDEAIGNRILPPPVEEDEAIGNRVDDRRPAYARHGDENAFPFPGERRTGRPHPGRPNPVARPASQFEDARPEAPFGGAPRPRFEGAPRPVQPRRAPRPYVAPVAVEGREAGFEAEESLGFTGTPFSELDHEKLELIVQNVASTMVNAILGETPVNVKILENRVDVRVECGDDSGLLIGREGQTLAALQYLASRIVSRTMEASVRVQFDVGDYRERQDDRLRELALALAERVRATGRPCSTRPMSSYHRRLVHMALQDAPDMQTRSSGEGPLKRVIIQRRRERERGI